MIQFNTLLLKFAKKGDKTGWTYIEISADLAQKLKPNNKKSFRVKGKLDRFAIKQVALIPMGEGVFIMAINAAMRKGIGKRAGAMVKVQLELDKAEVKLDDDLMTCLSDEADALKFFQSLTKSHQNYFSKWIQSAKTDATKAKRIAQTVNAMVKKQRFPEMLREAKARKL